MGRRKKSRAHATRPANGSSGFAPLVTAGFDTEWVREGEGKNLILSYQF